MMLLYLYGIGFLLAFGALALLFAFKGELAQRYFKQIMWGAVALYGISLVAIHAPLEYKFQTLARDMLFLGISGAIFSRLAGWKNLFRIGVLVSIVAVVLFYRMFVGNTFPFRENLPLDQQGELLIELKEGHQIGELQKMAERNGLVFSPAFKMKQTQGTELDNYYLVNIDAAHESQLRKIFRRLNASSAVAWTEENEQIQVSPLESASNAARLPSKFGINDPGVSQLWAFERMQMDKLYNYLDQNKIQPKKRALIAILDTGVDANHEDLKDNFVSIDNNSNRDAKGHGTHCAGIAAAVSNNGLGVASFSRDNRFARVTSYKVLSDQGFGTQQGIIQGIISATDAKADVISMSLGGRSNQASQRAYNKAVQYASKAGAIVVAAAGNSNRNANDFSPVNSKGVIGVTAVDSDLNRAEFSNFVPDHPMGIAAPGVGIYSTIPGNKYDTYNGTSMATPYVAGLLGLLKSLRPDLTAQQAYNLLKDTGMNTRSSGQTGQFIQPFEAVKQLGK